MKWGLGAGLTLALAGTGPALGRDMMRLTVAGPQGTTVYDMADLRALGTTQLATSTPWTDGVSTFTGVTLSRLIGADAPAGGTLRLIALNDYEVVMPVGDVGERAPIIAYLRDDQPMSVRDKGPYWIVFPFDEGGAYNSELVLSRSVWQLVRIEVVP